MTLIALAGILGGVFLALGGLWLLFFFINEQSEICMGIFVALCIACFIYKMIVGW